MTTLTGRILSWKETRYAALLEKGFGRESMALLQGYTSAHCFNFCWKETWVMLQHKLNFVVVLHGRLAGERRPAVMVAFMIEADA